MSVFDGNGYFTSSYLINSSVSNTIVSTSSIVTSSINMLDINNNFQNIINVKNPINPQDAATKYYVDSLATLFTITLTGTVASLISNAAQGCFTFTVTNNVLNGPAASFHVVKNNTNNCGNTQRIASTFGPNGTTQLNITWPIGGGIYLNKTSSNYDGSYTIKMF
jgi:hypothetical protein